MLKRCAINFLIESVGSDPDARPGIGSNEDKQQGGFQKLGVHERKV
jgi:hypothetical protein